MSVTQVPLRPIARGSSLKYVLALAILVLAAFLLARIGAGSFKALDVDTVAAGHGEVLTDLDGVMLEYTGKTDDGTVFDSTEGRGPAPMLVGFHGYGEGAEWVGSLSVATDVSGHTAFTAPLSTSAPTRPTTR